MKYLLLSIFLFTGMPAFAVTKCVQEDGKVTYQDAACDSNVKTSAPVKIHQNAVGSGGANFSIDSSAPPEIQLMKMVALFESMEVDGRDCDWALKVYGSGPQIKKCDPLIKHMKGPFTQLLDKYVKLLKENGKSLEGRPEIARIDRASTNVLTSMNFLKARAAAGPN